MDVVVLVEVEEERRIEVKCDRSSEDALNTFSGGRDAASATTCLYCFSRSDRDIVDLSGGMLSW